MKIEAQQAVTSQQSTSTLQFTDMFSSIMPLLMIVLMFSIIKPLFSSMSSLGG